MFLAYGHGILHKCEHFILYSFYSSIKSEFSFILVWLNCLAFIDAIWHHDSCSTLVEVKVSFFQAVTSHARKGKFIGNHSLCMGWVGLWGFLWLAPYAKRKTHHRVSSGWSCVWHHSNIGLSSTQYEQIPIILEVWPFWLTPFFFRSVTFWRAYA